MSRSDWEVEISRGIVQKGRGWIDEILAGLGDPPDEANLSSGIWQQMERELTALLYAGLEAAFQDAALDLVLEAGFEVDWSMVNQAAADFARANAYTASRYCTETTHKIVGDLVGRFYREGWDLAKLQKELMAAGFPPVRANLIAITEVTKASSEAARFAARLGMQAGGEQVLVAEWMTMADERVCPTCGPLHGMQVQDGQPFTHPRTGEQIDQPPAHPACRCMIGFTVMTRDEWLASALTV